MVPSPDRRKASWPCWLAALYAVIAATASAVGVAAEKPLVILFGGYGTTAADMRLWERAAASDPVYGTVFDFEGIAYPNGAGSNVMRAVAAARGTLDGVADRLRAMPGRRIVVAGHSSGAALAVSTVSRVGQGDRIKLISLDAGIDTERPPDPGFFPITDLECWSAASGNERSHGYGRAETLCRDRFFVLRTTGCSTPVCLHYALVNRRPPADLTFKQSRALTDGISGGYADFSVNLDWLVHSR